MYAIIGIPLMLLFLTNIGDVMAKIFRFLYARSIRLKYRIILWHKRRKAAQIRRANSLLSRITRTSARSVGSGGGAGVGNQRVRQQQLDMSNESFIGGGSGGTVTIVGGGGVIASGGGGDFEDLLCAQAQLEQLEVKETVEAQLQRINVPLSLVLLTMFCYLIAGAILFCIWEGWTFLESFYFVYVSLTTIGFGDKFPGEFLCYRVSISNV